MPLYNPPTTVTFPTNTSSSGNDITNSLSNAASIIVPANSNRKGLTIYNNLSQTMYIDTSSSVSTTTYMVPIPAGAFYEMPSSQIYTGAFYGVLASGTGSVKIREFV